MMKDTPANVDGTEHHFKHHQFHLEHDHSHGHGHGHHGHHYNAHTSHDQTSHDGIKEFTASPANEHQYDHDKSHRDDVQRRLKLASVLCFVFLLSEVAGGLIAGSLAVLSDAAHLFSDLMGFVFAVAAGCMASLPGSENYTFGYRRWEVVAALFSMCSLAICSIGLEVEGIRRLLPHLSGNFEVVEEIDGKVMSIVAFIGVMINVLLALILGAENHVHMPGDDHNHDHAHSNDEHDHAHSDEHSHEHTQDDDHKHDHTHAQEGIEMVGNTSEKKITPEEDKLGEDGNGSHSHNHHHIHDGDHDNNEEFDHSPKPKENINLRAAYLHVLGDLVQSVAVLVAGVVITLKPEWSVIDPILSIIFCPIIFYSTLGVIRTSMRILLEGSPSSVKVNEVWSSIAAVDGITQGLCFPPFASLARVGTTAMTVHARANDPQSALHKVHGLAKEYGIDHTTIQIESSEAAYFISNPGVPYFYSPSNHGYALV